MTRVKTRASGKDKATWRALILPQAGCLIAAWARLGHRLWIGDNTFDNYTSWNWHAGIANQFGTFACSFDLHDFDSMAANV